MRKLVGLLTIALLCATSVHAQEQTGSIQGTIKDASGAVLPGVTVEARSPTLVGISTAVSDAQGTYRFPALPPGTYSITAKLSGFSDKKSDGVVLSLGQTLKIDLALAISGVSEAVTVTAESPLIDVKSSGSAATITKDVIDRIPKGRDFTNLVAANAPGADNESKSGGIQIDGASGAENRFIVDGMDTTDLSNNTSRKTVFTDFLQEVQVKTSGYAAEYGGNSGGVISAITKSGSNQFHGSAGTYYQNNRFNGADRAAWRINPNDNVTPEFLVTPSQPSQQWSPIGDIGGPVMKDKVWFYVGSSVDRTNNQETATFKNSPQPYFTGNFSSYSENSYVQWKGTTQLTQKMRLTVSGNNQRGQSRGSLPSLQPNGSKIGRAHV